MDVNARRAGPPASPVHRRPTATRQLPGQRLVGAAIRRRFAARQRQCPASLRELERYDFFILSDVPREAVSDASQDLIEKYVRDLGGGFLFAGGEAGYGPGRLGPQHARAPAYPSRMDAERRKEMPGVAMALVIDRSGS